MKQRHFLNGVEINAPINYAELQIELNYDKDSDKQTLSINDWEFGVGKPGDNEDGEQVVRRHFEDGLKSGVGVFEGLPFSIILDNEIDKTFPLFDGYVDVAAARFENGKITAPAVEQGKLVWLEDVADSFTFDYLANEKIITSSDYVAVPYCINKKQNGYELIITLLTLFVIIDKIREQIKTISKDTPNASNPFTAPGAILGLIVQILYIATLMTSLIALLVKLVTLLVQPVKYHYGMYAKDLIRIGCEHLGLGFKSSILQTHPFDKMLILPEKYNLKENTGPFEGVAGWLTGNANEHLGYYKGTFGEFLREMKSMFNARLVIDNGILYFEKARFNISKGKYTIPDLFDSRHKFSLNYEELKATYIISFSTDMQDRNTIQEYQGTSVQITTQPNTVNNKKMLLLKNLEEVRIRFALAKRKKELSLIEKAISIFIKTANATLEGLITVLNAIITAINAIIGVINKVVKALGTIGIKLNIQIPSIPTINVPNFGSMIEDRVGMMVMESDFVSVPKILMIENKGNPRNNKIPDYNFDFLRAKYLWEEFHYYNSFLPQKDSPGKQAILYDLEEVPFVFNDFDQARASKDIDDSQGREGELISLKFNPTKQTATGSFKIYQQYTKNLIETIYEPDGK